MGAHGNRPQQDRAGASAGRAARAGKGYAGSHAPWPPPPPLSDWSWPTSLRRQPASGACALRVAGRMNLVSSRRPLLNEARGRRETGPPFHRPSRQLRPPKRCGHCPPSMHVPTGPGGWSPSCRGTGVEAAGTPTHQWPQSQAIRRRSTASFRPLGVGMTENPHIPVKLYPESCVSRISVILSTKISVPQRIWNKFQRNKRP